MLSWTHDLRPTPFQWEIDHANSKWSGNEFADENARGTVKIFVRLAEKGSLDLERTDSSAPVRRNQYSSTTPYEQQWWKHADWDCPYSLESDCMEQLADDVAHLQDEEDSIALQFAEVARQINEDPENRIARANNGVTHLLEKVGDLEQKVPELAELNRTITDMMDRNEQHVQSLADANATHKIEIDAKDDEIRENNDLILRIDEEKRACEHEQRNRLPGWMSFVAGVLAAFVVGAVIWFIKQVL
ncbi:hypothetical protein ACFL2C_04275 [Patescibacteria group bacterium]